MSEHEHAEDVPASDEATDTVDPIEAEVSEPEDVDEPTEESTDDEPQASDDDDDAAAEDDELVPGDAFAALGLGDRLARALGDLGFTTPTPIQAEAIPVLLEGHDLLGQAATGTGKTAAFALPAIERLDLDHGHGRPSPQVLILAPTRELAIQVAEAIESFAAHLPLRVATVYGGAPITRQLDALRRGVHVVVATPGRALDHLRRRSLKLNDIATVILDEADEMLDMGFAEDLETILDATPPDRQTVMFSATLPKRIQAIAKAHQRNPVRIEIARDPADAATSRVRQVVYMIDRRHKLAALGRIIDVESPGSALVFCKTRGDVDELTVAMNNRGYRTEALHGGMDQHQRERVLGRLRDGTVRLLIATDVAARGIDVDSLTHVVNHDLPPNAEQYVHRIGRVGRAGRSGVAITLATPRQKRALHEIAREVGADLNPTKLPTVAELKASQHAMTVAAVRDALTADDLDEFEEMRAELVAGIVAEIPADADTDGGGDETAPAEPTPIDDATVLRAALKMIHTARGGALDTREIPDASQGNKRDRKDRDRSKDDRWSRDDRPGRRDRDDRGGRNRRDRDDRGGRDRDSRPTTPAGRGSIYIGSGKKAKVRPGDLVGAIAGETGLSGADIGPIRIAEFFSVVAVPEGDVDRVINALQRTTIRGRKPKVRRFVD